MANATSPQDAVAQVRQRLATIGRSRRFLEREQRRAVLQELTLQLEAITGPIAQAEPAAARELLWQFLELGNNVLGRCDDSSGLLGDVFRQAMAQLMWQHGDESLAKALVANKLYRAMAEEAADDDLEVEIYDELRGFAAVFEKAALELLDYCYK